MRTCSVSMPRSTRKALNGAAMPPVSISTARISLTSSRRPATAPAITSECPPIHLVHDSTTRSAPSSSGRQRYGEAKVLSTTTSDAVPVRPLDQVGQVGHDDRGVGDRLQVEHPGPGVSAASTASRSVGIDEDRLHAEAREDLGHQRPRAAVDGARRHDPIPGPGQAEQRAVDGGHARREAVGRLRALQLGNRAGHRGRGRVVDPRVGEARLPIGEDVTQLGRVLRRERGGLVDGHRVRHLADVRRRAGDADRARAETVRLGRFLDHGRTLHRVGGGSAAAGTACRWLGSPVRPVKPRSLERLDVDATRSTVAGSPRWRQRDAT